MGARAPRFHSSGSVSWFPGGNSFLFSKREREKRGPQLQLLLASRVKAPPSAHHMHRGSEPSVDPSVPAGGARSGGDGIFADGPSRWSGGGGGGRGDYSGWSRILASALCYFSGVAVLSLDLELYLVRARPKLGLLDLRGIGDDIDPLWYIHYPQKKKSWDMTNQLQLCHICWLQMLPFSYNPFS
jgi:hypothetical protein